MPESKPAFARLCSFRDLNRFYSIQLHNVWSIRLRCSHGDEVEMEHKFNLIYKENTTVCVYVLTILPCMCIHFFCILLIKVSASTVQASKQRRDVSVKYSLQTNSSQGRKVTTDRVYQLKTQKDITCPEALTGKNCNSTHCQLGFTFIIGVKTCSR